MRYLLILIVFVTYLTPPSFASSSQPMTIQALRQSIQLGDVPIEVTTTNADAKEHFLLGMEFLHAFMYDLAILQFQQAQKLDPGFAMSYWGEAMAYKHPIWNYEDLKKAQEILARYQKNKDKRTLTQKEQTYLQTANLLFSNQTLFTRDKAYMQSMKSWYFESPHDPDVGAFYALSLLGIASDFPNHKESQAYVEQGRRIINDLFKQFPSHPGVVHYFLHYHDTSDPVLARQALPAAKIALSLMRSSSHVTHMSAHIYRRLGLWDDYILANEISMKEADRLCLALKQDPLYGCNAENKYHSLEWLHDGYLKQNQLAKAEKLVNIMADIVHKDSKLIYKQWYYRVWARQVLYSKNWKSSEIKLEPIAQQDDQLYWSAYSECAALQASAFLAIHNGRPTQHYLTRLDTVITETKTLADPYIQQACQLARLKIKAETALEKGNSLAREEYLSKINQLLKQHVSTELTPSLDF
jgi:hypothetical protein